MTGQVLNHDDSIVGRHNQCLVALVEEPRPQGMRRICRIRGSAMRDRPGNGQTGKQQQSCQTKNKPGTTPRGLHRYRGRRGRRQRFQNAAAIRFVLRYHQQRALLKVIGGIDRNIFAARNGEAKLLLSAFLQEILVQTMAELTGIVPYDIVFSGVVARAPAKDVNTDLMFADLGGLSGNLALTHVEKKAGQQSRLGKAPAGDDALSQLPARLGSQIKNRFPRGGGWHIGVDGGIFRGCLEIW